MPNSTHQVPVIELNREQHPNADKLSIVRYGGYTIVLNTEDWADTNVAAWIQPDTLVDVRRPEFKYLDKSQGEVWYKVGVKKLRGVISYGMLVRAPKNARVGDDVAEQLGVKHYEPPVNETGFTVPAPFLTTKYDVDAFLKYEFVFNDGELVNVSEKIHGQNARYTFHNGQIYCGSRTEWQAEHPKSAVWKGLWATPELEKFIKDNPGYVVYGEVYGLQKGMKYGLDNGRVGFAAFDIYKDSIYLDLENALDLGKNLPWVPTIANIPFSKEVVMPLAEGNSLMAGVDHIREGVVIRPVKERYNEKIGRVIAKIINPKYLES